MNKKLIYISLFFLILILCAGSAIALNGEQGAQNPPGIYSQNINHVFPSNQIDDEINTTFSLSTTALHRPVVCDVDDDGRNEIITHSGSTVTISGMNTFDNLITEYQFENVIINTTTSQTINALACVNLDGDGQNKDLLIIHSGSVNGSSQIAIIEERPDFIDFDPVTYSFLQGYNNLSGGNTTYFLHGYYKNVMTLEHLFSCSEQPTDSSFGPEFGYECTFAGMSDGTRADGVMLFGTSAYIDSGNNQRFPIDDCTTGCASFYASDLNIDESPQPGFAVDLKTLVNYQDSTRDLWVMTDNVDTFIRLNLNAGVWTRTDRPNTMTNLFTNGVKLMNTVNYQGDNKKEICFFGTRDSNGNGRLQCWNNDHSGLIFTDDTTPSGGDDSYFGITAYDSDLNGDEEIFAQHRVQSSFISFDVFGDTVTPFNEILKSEDSSFSVIMSISRSQLNPENIIMLSSSGVITYNTTSGISNLSDNIDFTLPPDPAYHTSFIDLNNDFVDEILAYKPQVGDVKIYTSTAPSLPPASATIVLVNTSIVGDGYFGWYQNNTCAGNITFKAKECVGGVTDDCTYTATDEFSQERICTTCGDTIPFTCGVYSFATPEFNCDLVAGNYSIDLSIESTSQPGVYQASVTPDIPLNVISGISGSTCNIPTALIESPNDQLPDENDNGIGDGLAGDETTPGVGEEPSGVTADPDTEPVLFFVQTFTINTPPVIKFLISGLLILGLAIFASNRTNGNPVITIIGASLGAGISIILGFLAIEAVLIVIAIIVIASYALHKMNTPQLMGNGGS